MRRIIFNLVIISIFVFNTTLIAQENGLVIRYSKSIKKNEIQNSSKRVTKINSLLKEQVKNVSFSLFIKDYESIFLSDKRLVIENENEILQRLAGSIGGTKGIFYVSKKDSLYINEKAILDKKFTVSIDVPEWKVLKEFKYIDEYKCFKATRTETIKNSSGHFKNDVIAWFSYELPSFYGPAGYLGLPGTILEVDNGKIILRADSLSPLESIDEKIIKKPGIKKIISEEVFQKTARDIAIEKSKSYRN